PTSLIPHPTLEQLYLAARTRAETAICEAAVKRIENVDTTNDDVHTLARAIAELKKHDAAIERARAATRLADAKIESLRAATDKKNTVKKPYNHEEFMAHLRPAIRDIYGLDMPEGFEKEFPITSDCDLTAHATARYPQASSSSKAGALFEISNLKSDRARRSSPHVRHNHCKELADLSRASVASGMHATANPSLHPTSNIQHQTSNIPP
ncbi:MAG: hypothetical protein AABZ08_04120, partial [Planctomycetota bacterium]